MGQSGDEDGRNTARIEQSWRRNAQAWTHAVREGQIASRRLVTNRAIVEAVLSRNPRSVLDLGCGEGWLARELAARSIDVVGVDAVPELIELARAAGGAKFRVASYQTIATGGLDVTVDLVVCNFSLIGADEVEALFRAVPRLLNRPGWFIVQTLHPVRACGEGAYRDGWRAGSWDGFPGDFTDPAPWYFRTLAGWSDLFQRHGMPLVELRQPQHPHTGQPASALFVAECRAGG